MWNYSWNLLLSLLTMVSSLWQFTTCSLPKVKNTNSTLLPQIKMGNNLPRHSPVQVKWVGAVQLSWISIGLLQENCSVDCASCLMVWSGFEHSSTAGRSKACSMSHMSIANVQVKECLKHKVHNDSYATNIMEAYNLTPCIFSSIGFIPM